MTNLLSEIDMSTPGDPLLAGPVDWTAVGIVGIKVIVVFAALLIATMFMVWFERKVIADMQNRIGPNRTGPFGVFQTLADGLKLFLKEDIIPDSADKRIFRFAPILVVVPAFLVFAIIPIGGVVEIFGRQTRLQLADPPMGVLWLLVLSSISVYGVILAGWSSGSKYPLLGSVRASAQMISYEAALGLSLATVVLVTGALEMSQVVHIQSLPLGDRWPEWLHSWNILKLAVVPFVVYLIAITAELGRPPFDLVESEQELVAGYNTEYSSIRFAMFYIAEFMNTVTMSAVMVTLFLGGGDGPTFGLPAWLMYLAWFGLKTLVFMYVYVWIRGTLPKFRYDQLMDLGWKRLIPFSLCWLLLVAAAQLQASAMFYVLGASLVVGIVLAVAQEVGKERAQAERSEAEAARDAQREVTA